MKYVQASKPPHHDGGAFYEHEIHFTCPIVPRDSAKMLKQRIIDHIQEGLGKQHQDFRISVRQTWERDIMNMSILGTNIVVVRFQDKNKALLFKLSWVN